MKMLSVKSLAVFATVFLSQNALAFTLCTVNPGQIGWGNKNLKFKVNPSNCPANINNIVDTAMALWNSVPTSSLKMQREGTNSDSITTLFNGNQTDEAVIACD